MAFSDSLEELDEFFWNDLLDYIDEGRVIPIVESGALRVDMPGEPMTLDAMVATRLGQRLHIGLDDLGRAPRIDDVVSRYLAGPRARKEDLYVRTLQVFKDLELTPPQTLLDLAAIRSLDLFISVSFDPLLVRAIDLVRHGGEARTDVIAFAPNRNADLPGPRASQLRPTVFHLLGRLSSAPERTGILSVELSPSPDQKRRRAAVLHADRTVSLHDWSPVALLSSACDLANRNLSCVEWQQYFPGQPYHRTCSQAPEPVPACGAARVGGASNR